MSESKNNCLVKFFRYFKNIAEIRLNIPVSFPADLSWLQHIANQEDYELTQAVEEGELS